MNQIEKKDRVLNSEWIYFSGSFLGDSIYYKDITDNNNTLSVQILIDKMFKNPNTGSHCQISKIDINCENFSSKFLEIKSFSKPMCNGEKLRSIPKKDMDDVGWEIYEKGTLFGDLYRYLCKNK